MTKPTSNRTATATVAFCLVLSGLGSLPGTAGDTSSSPLEPVPAIQAACACGTPVEFSMSGVYEPASAYEWRRGATALVEGDKYTGTHTSTLIIHQPTSIDSGDNYNCVVTGDSGTSVSASAALVVNAVTGDFDHDCDVDTDDADLLHACMSQSGPAMAAPEECRSMRLDNDDDVDMADFGILQRSYGETAVAVPRAERDIVFVLDLSSSLSSDSRLGSVKRRQVANRAVWTHLWDTQLAPQPLENGLPLGPSLGNMSTWGDATCGPNGINTADPGLIRLPKGLSWTVTSAFASRTLSTKGYGTYTSSEMTAINSSSGDSSLVSYQRRVQVALGLVRWHSGKVSGQPGGNGDNVLDASELEAMVPYPSSASNPESNCRQVGGTWSGYIDYVVTSGNSTWTYDPATGRNGDPNCQYRYGLKTWLDYVLDSQEGDALSPGLAGAPMQPLAVETSGVQVMLTMIDDLQADDRVGLTGFGNIGYGPAEKSNNLSWLATDFASITSRLATFQAGMWTSDTNTAQGIDKGVDVLAHSPLSRSSGSKILVLFTDGQPTRARNGSPGLSLANSDAIVAAQDAAGQGVKLFVVGIGGTVDVEWLTSLAQAGGGAAIFASDATTDYPAQLFRLLQQFDPADCSR